LRKVPPTARNPINIIAQVAGSGTAELMVSVPIGCEKAPLRYSSKTPLLKVGAAVDPVKSCGPRRVEGGQLVEVEAA